MANSHGRFVWYELTTTDMRAAKAFYAAVVGWGARDASMAGMPYTVFTAGDASVSGMMELPKDARKMGERPMWIGYICVDDVDAAADRIERLGGAVHVPPQDILYVSRFQLSLTHKWQRLRCSSGKAPVMSSPLTCAHEATSAGTNSWPDDWDEAWAIYSELFGWQKAEANVGAMGAYQQFSAGGQTIGGMMTKPPMVPVSCWLYLRIQRALDNPLYQFLFPNTRIEVKGGGRDADAGPIRSIGRESL
jgi:uncharacterized protein